jgi:organic radical activating enzyme
MNLFKQFTAEGKQDAISPTYCAAKWFEGTIWLHKGMTASCHHTPLDNIDLDTNFPSSLFNTSNKILDRAGMLSGIKVEGCNYCWAIEDKGGVSDRRIKSKSLLNSVQWYKKTDLISMPVQLEIAFDRTCNLSCAYCGPAFSSKWANDIKQHGPYVNLITDSKYTTPDEVIDEDNNPYVTAFFNWLPTLSKTLNLLRITGGEPLMSPNFWKFIDYVNEHGFDGELHINTNLVNHKGEVTRLIEKTKGLKIMIHTSLESSLDQAEYVRSGFDKNAWMTSVNTIMLHTDWVVNVTTAVSSFTVWNYVDYLDLMLMYKRTHGNNRIEITCNFVNYPVFMRIDLIPKDKREPLAVEVSVWLNKYKKHLNKHEVEQINRFITVVGNSEESTNYPYIKLKDALHDLKTFVPQYDKRKGISYKCLDKRFVEWYESI